MRMEEALRGQEQLVRQNEELQRQMDARSVGKRVMKDVEPDFQSFSLEILNEQIPANYVFPKIGSFNGKQDLNAHVKNFRTQMLIYGGLVM